MIREDHLLDVAELDPARVLEAAVAYRDSAARMAAHAREAESAQAEFAANFRSRRMPDTVAGFAKPGRVALDEVHTTAQDLCHVLEAACDGHRDLARRREELWAFVETMYARDIPVLLEAWMLAHGAMHYPEVHEVPAAEELEADAYREVEAFNRSAEQFVLEFERSVRSLHAAARDRLAAPKAVTATAVSVTKPAPLLPGKKLRAMSPAEVAKWWGSLTAAARQRYVKELSGVIGGLDGVDARSRSAANRAELARFVKKLKKIKKGDPAFDAAQVKLKAVAAIERTLGKNPEKRDPPMQLLLLDLSGENPKAAISVGDLDTADHVTFNIPGMMTTVAKDMNGWTEASKNLYRQQQFLSRKMGGSDRVAVVAWLGYGAPQNVLEVNANDSAHAGGKALARALEGTLAARGWPARSANLSVVGFSYGSAVGGEALKRASAGSFVSVGSAGIPGDVAGRVPYRAPLNVPEGGVSSGQASADATATFGRGFSGRSDPSAYGAVPFSTDDGRTPDGRKVTGTTDHAATVHATDPTKYGYYDKESTSLYNMAAHSMGLPEAMAR